MLPASYIDAHRYDGAAIERGKRDRREPCTVQPRDIRVRRDVRRHKFLTAPQLRELWWPQRSVQAADRRLLKLFRAGYLERFRPLARRGSFPWTYHLGAEGHRLLQHAGIIGPRERFNPRAVYDYGHVLHELQLNAWVLATRRALGTALRCWEGETHLEPPPKARQAPPDRPAHRARWRRRVQRRGPQTPRPRPRWLVRPQAPPDRRRRRAGEPAGPHPRALAHARGLRYEQYGREQAEVLVDCVTYCVLGSVGLDVGGESIPYVAGWGEDGALDAIREYAETIDTIARRIEDALDPEPDTPRTSDAFAAPALAA